MTAPRAPADRAELIEVMARTLFVSAWYADDDSLFPRDDHRAAARTKVRVVLAALEAAGVWVVPGEMTTQMDDARREAWGRDVAWPAMLAASPYAPEPPRG